MTEILDREGYRNIVKNWWVALISGIIFLLVSLLVFTRPGDSYMSLSLTFGVMVLISGLLSIYQGSETPKHAGKGWIIVGGIIELLLGILLVFLTTVTITILPFLLGFWLMFRGFTIAGIASDMMGNGVKGAGWTLFLGILVVICSFIILANPLLGIGTIVVWIGVSLLLASISLFIYTYHLRKLEKQLFS
jgi:uncharacterized membrane protein HdeD (DUF308 family)